MAYCEYCGKEMLFDDTGCFPKINIGGKIYKRIPYGEERFFKKNNTEPLGRCGDCGVAIGKYHHFECDMENCPVCGAQLLWHIHNDNKTCPSCGVILSLVDENNNDVVMINSPVV